MQVILDLQKKVEQAASEYRLSEENLLQHGLIPSGLLVFGVGMLLRLPFTYLVIYSAFGDITGIPN